MKMEGRNFVERGKMERLKIMGGSRGEKKGEEEKTGGGKIVPVWGEATRHQKYKTGWGGLGQWEKRANSRGKEERT